MAVMLTMSREASSVTWLTAVSLTMSDEVPSMTWALALLNVLYENTAMVLGPQQHLP